MFLVNSRLGHFSAPASPRVPFSLSYGVNLPNSLAVIHSSTLGFSPHPPVSVYGTGRLALNTPGLFLRVWLPALSPRPKTQCTVVFQSPYALQPSIPSDGGSFTPRSPGHLQSERRNINRLLIGCPFRVPLSPRLTLIRLALFRKPWVFGERVSTRFVVTYAYIFFSGRSSTSHNAPSAPTGMLPYHSYKRVPSFGGSLDARSLSTRRRSTSELLRTL